MGSAACFRNSYNVSKDLYRHVPEYEYKYDSMYLHIYIYICVHVCVRIRVSTSAAYQKNTRDPIELPLFMTLEELYRDPVYQICFLKNDFQNYL